MTDATTIRHYLATQRPRDAARAARALLQNQPKDRDAALLLAEALLALGQSAAAHAALPAMPTTPEATMLAARVELARLRAEGAALWQQGDFAAGHILYRDLHAREAALRATYQPLFAADPANDAMWRLLQDAVGNYRLSAALTGALPDPAAMRRAFLMAVTGDGDHPTQRHRTVVAPQFHHPGAWPDRSAILNTRSPAPRLYRPSCFGTETPALLPAQLLPVHTLKLPNALAYSAGLYLYLQNADGRAPWLQGGMWGPQLERHLPFILPQPFSYLAGAGLGHAVAALPKPALQIDEPVAVLGYWNNHGHVLHDILPQLQDAEAQLGKNFRILAVADLLPSVQQAFALMGYAPERFITIPAGTVAALREAWCFAPRTQHQRLRLFTPALEPQARHYDVALDDDGLDFVRNRLQPASGAAPHRKLYVTRRGTARAPENEAALEALLQEQGFTVIQPEALPLAEQIALFAETRVLVGLEGAALANMLFMPPGGQVLVLRSHAWGWSVNCFDELARYGRHALRHLDFAGRMVPPEALRAALKQLAA